LLGRGSRIAAAAASSSSSYDPVKKEGTTNPILLPRRRRRSRRNHHSPSRIVRIERLNVVVSADVLRGAIVVVVAFVVKVLRRRTKRGTSSDSFLSSTDMMLAEANRAFMLTQPKCYSIDGGYSYTQESTVQHREGWCSR
jgi:hypothetical protein